MSVRHHRAGATNPRGLPLTAVVVLIFSSAISLEYEAWLGSWYYCIVNWILVSQITVAMEVSDTSEQTRTSIRSIAWDRLRT